MSEGSKDRGGKGGDDGPRRVARRRFRTGGDQAVVAARNCYGNSGKRERKKR